MLCFTAPGVKAQASQTVSEVITTFHTYWKSGISSVNPLKPDSSHDLLAFTFNGTRYSTGVNDALLTTHGDGIFSAQKFQSLPVSGISGTPTSNTKIALGQMYDGVDNGASNPPPVNNLAYYLTDGNAGLNLGTGVANLPQGDLNFDISNIKSSAIGDGIPDILITQIADPSGGTDSYEFTTSSGVTVGTIVPISFSGISAVGNWTGDFYEASTNPMTLATGFTKTDRTIKLWAADLSYFGITSANYASIRKFTIHLNGNTDLAFIAYNPLTSIITMPVTLSYFRSSRSGSNVKLTWQTSSEFNTGYFNVETSTDGQNFIFLHKIAAAGNSGVVQNYSYRQSNVTPGVHYYRLQEVDNDGKYMYSNILKEMVPGNIDNISVSPNPARNIVVVNHAIAKAADKLELFSITGKRLSAKSIRPGSTQTSFDVTTYPRGNYIFVISSSEIITGSIRFTIN